MKELEEGIQKLKEAIELKDPYIQIEALGIIGNHLIYVSNELGHSLYKCMENDLK